jgi:hypothetical protein
MDRSRGGGSVSETREVRLPADLCASAEKKFAPTFSNVEELLVFILRDLCRDEAAQLEQLEQRLVEERLKELGYL